MPAVSPTTVSPKKPAENVGPTEDGSISVVDIKQDPKPGKGKGPDWQSLKEAWFLLMSKLEEEKDSASKKYNILSFYWPQDEGFMVQFSEGGSEKFDVLSPEAGLDDKFIAEFEEVTLLKKETRSENPSSQEGSYWTNMNIENPEFLAQIDNLRLNPSIMTEEPQGGDLSTRCPCGTDHSLQAGPMPDGHT